MSIFNYLDYKKALKDTLLEAKKRNPKITFEAMAQACRVQKTYLSKVLNREGDLNEDQLETACEFLDLSFAEKDFMLLLRSHSISTVPTRQKRLLEKILQLQKENLKTESKIKVEVKELSVDEMQTYYLDPLLQILHMYLTIRRFALAPSSIASLVGIAPEVLDDKLRKLQSLGVITFEKNQVRVLKDNLHLAQNSPLFRAYRNLLRSKANERMDSLPEGQSYSFSVVFSSNETTRVRIHQLFLDYLKAVQNLVGGAPEEDVYQINFDLLPWS